MHRDQVFRLLDRVLQREANIRIRRIERPAVIRRAFDLSRLKGDIGHASEFAVLHAQAVVAALLQSFDIRLRPGMLQRIPERVELRPIRLLNRQIDGLRLLWVCKNSLGQIVIGEPETDLSAANRRLPIRVAAGKVAQLATIEYIEFAVRRMVHDQRIAILVDHLAVAEPLLERLTVLQRELRFLSYLRGNFCRGVDIVDLIEYTLDWKTGRVAGQVLIIQHPGLNGAGIVFFLYYDFVSIESLHRILSNDDHTNVIPVRSAIVYNLDGRGHNRAIISTIFPVILPIDNQTILNHFGHSFERCGLFFPYAVRHRILHAATVQRYSA